MPQGTYKPKPKSAPTKLSTAHSASQKQKANTPRNRVIKPKHSSALARHQNMAKKGASQLTGMLEKKLAERAGYVEMVGKQKEGEKKKAEEQKAKRAGPSFGKK